MRGGKKAMSTADLLHHVLDQEIASLFHVGALHFRLTQHLMMLCVAGLIVLVTANLAARTRLAGRSSRLATAMESIVVVIRDQIVFPAMGEHYGRKYLSFFLTLAALILTSNLLGLIPVIHIGHFPIGGSATGNFWLNLALATTVYVFGVFCAVREHGVGAYLHSFLPHGVPIVLAPLIWFIEWAGMAMKHIVLAIRLTANMMAGHLVLFAILGMIVIILNKVAFVPAQLVLSVGPVVLALAIYCLELLVAFIQAAIFVILSAIFFGMAVNPHH
jgi:F-type H+-transporting ATPase subunit a